jgi:xanthine dehydrogenase YagS FAD-binding subunit
MINFEFSRANTVKGAIDSMARMPAGSFIAGGTNLVDLMKKGVTAPPRIIDINSLPLKQVEESAGGVLIGALASNSWIAEHETITKQFPLLSLALRAGASPQLRNMATVGGNMMQRTRCGYFYDVTMPCNKRNPGTGCSALKGYNRMHAIFGTSDKCIAVHPSDMCVALVALDANVNVSGQQGERSLKFADFHRLPGETPSIDNNLKKGELITGVSIPSNPFTKHVHYLKIRDRASYAFALVSVAAALELDGDRIKAVRLAMGGVAHKPWRLTVAEKFLVGKTATTENFKKAAALSMQGARSFGQNDFKLKMAPVAIVEALTKATTGISA